MKKLAGSSEFWGAGGKCEDSYKSAQMKAQNSKCYHYILIECYHFKLIYALILVPRWSSDYSLKCRTPVCWNAPDGITFYHQLKLRHLENVVNGTSSHYVSYHFSQQQFTCTSSSPSSSASHIRGDFMCTSQSDRLAPSNVVICISVHTPCILSTAEWAATAICPVSQLKCCQTSTTRKTNRH